MKVPVLAQTLAHIATDHLDYLCKLASDAPDCQCRRWRRMPTSVPVIRKRALNALLLPGVPDPRS
jgi:hypothetical protein